MSPLLKQVFGGESGRAVKRHKPNAAGFLVAVPSDTYHNAPDVIGINPQLSSMPAFAELCEALLDCYGVEEITSLPRAEHLQKFQAATFAAVDFNFTFATEYRTRILVALEALGGRYDIGKLQTSTLDTFVTFARKAIFGLVEEGVLKKTDEVISFNHDVKWMPQFRAFLAALAVKLPYVVEHALKEDEIRGAASAGTRHAYGTKFFVFGSRVKQGMLTYLATYGPSRITEINGAINAVNPKAIFPLIEEGIVCQTHDPGPNRREWRYSLNAHHLTYRELRALLRTEVMRDMVLPAPLNRPLKLYDGPDDSQDLSPYYPYQLFGVSWRKAAVTNIFAMLLHTRYEEAEATSLEQLASEHDWETIQKAMKRWMQLGIVYGRTWKALKLYSLREEWPAYNELRALLKAIGREWNEYPEGAAVEYDLFKPLRKSRERGRSRRPSLLPQSLAEDPGESALGDA